MTSLQITERQQAGLGPRWPTAHANAAFSPVNLLGENSLGGCRAAALIWIMLRDVGRPEAEAALAMSKVRLISSNDGKS